MKNILILNAQVDFWGASRSCLSSAIALKEAGYDVMMMATWRGPIASVVEDNGIRFEVCPFGTWMAWPGKRKIRFLGRVKSSFSLILHSITDFFRMRKKLGNLEFKPDIVYSNTIMQPMGLMLSAYFKIPHVYHIREYGKADFGMFFILGEKFSYYLANRYTLKALCISKGVQKEWSKCFGNKAVLLYNGISHNSIHHDKRMRTEGGLKILMVGRLSVEKGQRDVIEAIGKIKSQGINGVSLDLYGEGTDREYLKMLSSSLDLEQQIKFCGFSQDIPYHNYDIAVMASRSEGFGRTTLEYMMYGVPVIGYNGGATPELIRDNITGQLYNNVDELSECITDAYLNYKKFQDYASAAFDVATTEFSEENYRKHLVDIFKKMQF